MSVLTQTSGENAGIRSFYGLKRPAFGPVLEPAQVIHAPSRSALVDGVVTDLLVGRTVIAIEGEHGVGKTVLLDAIGRTLSQHRLVVVRLGEDEDGPLQVQRTIGEAVGIAAAEALDPPELVRVVEGAVQGRLIVLLLDDADAVPGAVFRYLWLLLCLFNFGRTQVHIVMAGGLGDWPGLDHPELAGLRQAIGKPTLIMPLGDDEARAYLDGKLRGAGTSLRRVMTSSACAELLEIADGIPGQIDALTQRVMERGYQFRRRRIDVPVLHKALFRAASPQGDGHASALPAWFLGLAAVGAGVIMAAAVVAVLESEPSRRTPAPARPSAEVESAAVPPARPAADAAEPAPAAQVPPAPIAPQAAVALARPATGGIERPPASVPIRVALTYRQGAAGAEETARNVAAVLAANGVVVTGPAPTTRRTSSRIGFFFSRDHDAAAWVGDVVASVTRRTETVRLIHRTRLPPPGTVELTVTGP